MKLRRPSPALVVSVIALGVALSPAAEAAKSVLFAQHAAKADYATNANFARSAGYAHTAGKAEGALVAEKAWKADNATASEYAATAKKAETATRADTAAKADSATTAANADKLGGLTAEEIAASSAAKPFSFTLSDGQTRTIATNGPLSLVAACDIGGVDPVNPGNPGFDSAYIRADTTAGGGMLATQFSGSGQTLDTSTPENERLLAVVGAPSSPDPLWSNATSGLGANVTAADGSGFIVGDATTLGVHVFGEDCAFSGFSVEVDAAG